MSGGGGGWLAYVHDCQCILPIYSATFFFQSVTINSVDFDGFLRLQFPKSLSKLKVLSFLSGTLFVIGHVFWVDSEGTQTACQAT